MKFVIFTVCIAFVCLNAAFAADLTVGQTVKVDTSSLSETYTLPIVKPWLNASGDLQLLGVNSKNFMFMDLNGNVLATLPVTFCREPRILVSDVLSVAAVSCENFTQEISFVDLKALTVKTIPISTRFESNDGKIYDTRYGVNIHFISDKSGDDSILAEIFLENLADKKDQLTQFRLFSLKEKKQTSAIEMPGYFMGGFNRLRFFKNKADLHMLYASTWRSNFESSTFGEKDVAMTFNLTKGQLVNSVEVKHGVGYADCLNKTDLAEIGGVTYVVAKKNPRQSKGGCEGLLNIKWNSYKEHVLQFSLINPLTFEAGPVVESKYLKEWNHLADQDPNTYYDSVSYINGRAYMRSSYENMANHASAKALYVDLTTGNQVAGPIGRFSFLTGQGLMTAAYSMTADIQSPELAVYDMDKSGKIVLSVPAPRCRGTTSGKCLLYEGDDTFNSSGGFVLTRGHLYFVALKDYKSDEISILRLQ